MNFTNTEEAFVLSSLNEFVKVWGSGGQSNLNLECRNGFACIKLSFNLGHPTSPHLNSPQYFSPAKQPTRRRNGPARKLKNIERAKAHHTARLVAAATAANQATMAMDESSVSSEPDVLASRPTSPSPAQASPPPPPPATSPAHDPVTAAVSALIATPPPPLPAAASAADVCTTTEAAPASRTQTSAQYSTVPVHCIATFDNCPDEEITEDYADSLRRYLTSEDHLNHNIMSANFKHVSTRRLRNRFIHTVEVVLQVKTERLWENAASYIRKHLGATNEWSRGNGTLIKLSRIHQT